MRCKRGPSLSLTRDYPPSIYYQCVYAFFPTHCSYHRQRTTYSNSFIHHIIIKNYSGMIQKSFNVYEETLKIPMTFSNPKLFPAPLESEQLVSLVDILPTLATLLSAPKSAYPKRKKKWSGVDFSSVVLNPLKAKKVQDYTIFTYYDYQSGKPYQVNSSFVGLWPEEPSILGTCISIIPRVCVCLSSTFFLSWQPYAVDLSFIVRTHKLS